MAAVSNIPRDIQESIRDVLDKRVKVSVKRLVKMEIRGDKMDNRVLAFSPCRLFVMTAKVPSKLENSFHFLDIQSIESKKLNQLTLTIEGKAYTFNSIEATSDEMDHMITHIGISLKQIFPSFPLERLIVKIDVQPTDRLRTMQDMIKNIEKKDVGPCGGFTTMYQCMCDYYSLPFREEVAWDVDTIYLSHDSRELRLQDFDHLNGKDLVPIIAALEHNSYFKKINASNVKLTPEACSELIKVMKRNAVIEEVNLSNTGIKIEFVQKFALAIISNSGTQLTSLDLSNNLLEDKAITHLMGAIKMLPCGLTSFDVSRTGISTRCLNKIGEVLGQSPNVLAVLTTLKVNDNGFKGDDFPMLYNCLAQPNAISYLDLSFTDCALDTLCDPLLRGCPNLATLKASRTVFTHKRNKDAVVPQSFKQFFASSWCLEHVDISSCKLPVEALKELLLGLASNRNINGLYLDLSSNELGTAGANVIASCISTMTSLKGLDLSNNGFDIDLKALVPEIAKNTYLRQLSIGRNFANIKPKHMPDVMNAFALLLQEETSALESLSLADSKLKADTTYVINALGSNNSLQEIDISGNLIGDIGARMLAKALMINTKLRKVVWDKNAVSAQGFEDVAEAMQKNMTLRKMPFPVNDAAAALKLYPDRTEIALQKIESFLQRNHSPRKFASDQAYRLQQGFLISSTQQMVDRLVVQVQDTVNALRSLGTMEVYANDVENAEKLVADASNSRQLFPGLQDIAIKSQAAGNSIDVQLQTMADKLRQTIEEQMKKTTEDMLKCTSDHCPAIMTNPTFQNTIKEGCHGKSSVPKDFTTGVLEGASADIFNMTGEMNLAVAALISDSVIEEVIESLSVTHKTLTNHLNLRRSGVYKEKEDKAKEEEADPALKSKSAGEASPKFANKRKSLLNRKTRPQSTMGEEALALSGKHLDEKSGLQNLEERSTESTPLGSTEHLNDFGELPSASFRPLEHITKARPRREKAHRPTRPVVVTGSTEMEEGQNNGLNPLYQTQTSHVGAASERKESVKEESSVVHPKPEPPKAKPEEAHSGKSEGKKWILGFGKKNKEDKQDKQEKETKEAKKSNSFSSSFSSIFKKKDDKKRPSVSDESKPDVDASAEPPAADQAETKPVETLEVVKEIDQIPEDTSNAIDLSEPEKTEEKVPITPKAARDRLPSDRPAMLPPTRKLETRSPTLATEEDTSLGGDDTKPESEEPPPLPEAPPPDESEEKKEEGPKMPAGLAKLPGLGALGGKNLLQEMKLKQEKRFSKLPSPGTEEKELPKEKAAKETNNNVGGSKVGSKEGESPSKDVRKTSPVSKPPELTKPLAAKQPETAKPPIAKHPEPAKAPPSDEDHGKKDLNDNTPEASPSRSVLKPTPAPPSKGPSPAPRAMLPPKRPVSTVEDSGSSQEVPKSMTTSTPELLLGDGSGNKPRPAPPVKPRPPVMPRPRKRESGTEDNAASETSQPPACAPSPPSTLAAKSTPTVNTTTLASKMETETESNEEPQMRNPAPPTTDEGIVYDSATLRLSVKDKIKRLSQGKGVSDAPSPTPAVTKQKAASLPKDAKLPENMPEESRGGSRKESAKEDGRLPEDWKSPIEEEETPVPSPKLEKTPMEPPPDDEIMV